MPEWVNTVGSISLALRIVLFENYGRIVAALWWFATLLVAVAAAAVHWGGSVAVFVSALILYRFYARAMRRFRRLLIRKGDRVEYAPASDAATPEFSSAVVLYGMGPKEAVKTSFFNEEEAALYTFFYLVRESKEKNRLIPFEWVIGIELDARLDSADA